MIDSLKKIGLNETESNIYLQLIKKGALTAVGISKEIKVHRRTIYDNLNVLINKGLVSYFIEKDIKYFQANNPKILKKIEEEKNDELTKIFPVLKSFYENQKKNPNISILKGIESSKLILTEMIETKEEIFWMGGGFKILDCLGYSEEFLLKELLSLNIKIIQPTPHNENFKKYFSKSNLKIIDKKYQSDISFFVYEDIVIIGSLINGELFLIKIENSEIAKAYKNYFNLIWKSN